MNVRLPVDLKERLENAAVDNNRSFKAELVSRLEESFETVVKLKDITDLFLETIRENAENSRRELEEYRQMIGTIKLLRHTIDRIVDEVGAEALPADVQTLVSILQPKQARPHPDDMVPLLSEILDAMEKHERILADQTASGIGSVGKDRADRIRKRLHEIDDSIKQIAASKE